MVLNLVSYVRECVRLLRRRRRRRIYLSQIYIYIKLTD